MATSHFIYSFISCWTLVYYECCCYKYSCTRFCMHAHFHFCWVHCIVMPPIRCCSRGSTLVHMLSSCSPLRPKPAPVPKYTAGSTTSPVAQYRSLAVILYAPSAPPSSTPLQPTSSPVAIQIQAFLRECFADVLESIRPLTPFFFFGCVGS